MSKKPTYEELEQSVKKLEQEAVKHKQVDEALTQSEERYRTFIDSTSDIVFLKDEHFRHVMVNEAYAQYLGRTEKEIIGKTDFELLPKYLAEGCRQSDLDTLKSDGLVVSEEREEDRVYETRKFPVSLGGGKFGIGGYVRDITEQKQAEEALRESEKEYRLLANNLPGIVFKGHKDWFVEFFDNKIESLTGYNIDEFNSRRMKWNDIIVKEDIETSKRSFIRALKTDKAYVREYRIRPSDGEIHWIQERSHIDCDDKGEIESVNGIFFDITDRKIAEEALRESEEKYRHLFDNAQVGLYRTRISDGKFVEANDALARMFGYEDRTDILDAEYVTSDNYVDPDTRENLLVILREHGEFSNFEARLYRKDRSVAWFRYSGRIFPEKGYIEGIAADITEEKRLEAQLQQALKMEAIGTLSGGIAHDFNNILGIIIGNAELAMDNVPEWNPAHFNLEEIKTAGIRAKDIVRQLLSFSRKTAQERKPIQIIPVIKDSLKFLRATIPTSIDIRQDMQATDDTILADPTQIHQVMMNLCTNASHAVDTGGIMGIVIENVVLDEDSAVLYPDLIPDNYVRVTVSDTGQGIAPEAIDRIFDPYFTTKEVGKGTGMGLSVVHGIIKSHGGAISVDSELGKGTTFSVLFPVIEKQADSEIETDEEFPTGSERILFVDDEESMVYVGRYRLERLGYQVEAQTSPVQALKLFQAKSDQFDLVITDMTMPRMTGDMLVKEILKIRPDMPTILCTGFSEKIDEVRSKELGISAYIEKPLDRCDLAKLVRKVLDNKKEEQVTGRVLVIEDEPQMRKMLKQMLEEKGCDVVEASDGNEGIKLYRANPFDLIVTDIIMPEKEGIETIMELKKDFPYVKIIAISGGGRIEPESYLNLAKQLGAK